MNYIGSKWSLLPFISEALSLKGIQDGVFLDIFAGTTAVGQLAKRLGFQVISNDWQYYSYVLGSAYIKINAYPEFTALKSYCPQIFKLELNQQPKLPVFDTGQSVAAQMPLQQVINWLNVIAGHKGLIYNNYCLGGTGGSEFERQYFSDENGSRCDAIRCTLRDWRACQLITQDEYFLVLASLLEAIDKVANTASVYGAFLKHLKKPAQKPLHLQLPEIIASQKAHLVFQKDANVLIGETAADVLYLDPPYNHRQYNANYHLLETIASDDDETFIQPGITGLRANAELDSVYCQKETASEAFAALIQNARAKHILVSYNDEGVIPLVELRRILKRRGALTEYRKAYKRFRADLDYPGRKYAANDFVHELLFYVKVEDALIFMISKPTFEQIEGIFHDGLGTYNELLVANQLIQSSQLPQSLYSVEAAATEVQKALDLLEPTDARRNQMRRELQNIEAGAVEVAVKILELIRPGLITKVVHSAKEYAGGKAGDLIISFAVQGEEKTLPVSLKTDKSGKAALADIGQTSNLYRWFEALFKMGKDEVDGFVASLSPGKVLKDLQKNYLDVAHLVQRVFIAKLGLMDVSSSKPTSVNNLAKAHPGNLAALRFLFEQVKYYRNGSDKAVVIVTNRETGKVSTQTVLDEVVIPTLALEEVTFRPSRPKAGKAYSSEIGVRYKDKVVFTVQIKQQRGKTVSEASKNYFHGITTRLAI